MARNTLKLHNDPPKKSPRVWVWRLLFISLALIILWKSLEPFHGSPGPPYTDKIRHFFAYLVLTLLALFSRLSTRQSRILIGILVYGAGIELLQGAMNMGRTASLADFIANLLGIFFAWGLWKGLQSLKG